MSDIYQDKTGDAVEKQFTLSVLTEDLPGLLNNVTIIFTRRKLNIDMINVSSSEVPGVSRYTIVLTTTREQVEKVVKQIRKHIDVLGAFVYEEDEIHYQEIALYKVPTRIFMGGVNVEKIIRANNARILVIEQDYILIEKTGHKEDTQKLYDILEPYGIMEFVRSGRVAVSKSKRKTEQFLEELENSNTHSLSINGQNK
ncbi:MAG TPA: acetolactate synthase small subunit [Cytophagales bacterium]|jgi:acetolactate synthase-1/3 small subunit|nr:acetolactate synthase small subunit [Cytophagales bacterium]